MPTVDELDFSRSTLVQVANGLLLKPVLENFLDQATTLVFPGVPSRDLGTRPADGWFHPSTHPMWTEPALYAYLTRPELVAREPMDRARKDSVTVGTAMHGYRQWCLRQAGVLPPELQACTICPPELKCTEPGFLDNLTGARTHADGVLALLGRYGQDLYEYKTSQENTYQGYKRLNKIEDLDNEAFKATWPDYWAQAIEVQRISGLRRTIVIVESLGFPWTLKEFHVEWDPEQASVVQEKYLRVRAAVRAGRPPACPCDRPTRAGCAGKRFCG